MSAPKLSRESRHAFARRFAANLRRLLDEKKLSLSEFGRRLRPSLKNPASATYALLHGRSLPADDVVSACAKVLGVPVEKLHAGELDDYKSSPASGPTGQTRPTRRTPRRRGYHPASPEPPPPPGCLPAAGPGTPGEGEDELYGFVLDAVRARAGALIEPRRGEFIRALARLCREYQA